MKIEFLRTYAGRETAMRQYEAGAVDDVPNAQALELIRLGVAVEVIQVQEREPVKRRVRPKDEEAKQ